MDQQDSKPEIPESSNFHAAVRGPQTAREVAQMYESAGWSSRHCGWKEYEVTHTIAELIIEGRPVIVHGSVADPKRDIDVLLRPLLDHGVDFFCECYEPDGSLLLNRDSHRPAARSG